MNKHCHDSYRIAERMGELKSRVNVFKMHMLLSLFETEKSYVFQNCVLEFTNGIISVSRMKSYGQQ